MGLHETADASRFRLPEKERAVRQRTYIAIRIFDAYVTSSLGLPRNFRDLDLPREPLAAPYIDGYEMLKAANANAELLGILSHAREEIYSTNTTSQVNGSTMVGPKKLDEINKSLRQWAVKYPVFSLEPGDKYLENCCK